MGSANSQSPLCWHEAAKNDARLLLLLLLFFFFFQAFFASIINA